MEYKLYHSKLIENNHSEFVYNSNMVFNTIKEFIGNDDVTWNFNKYNIFSISSSSTLFYYLYKELNFHIRSFIGDERPLWLQAWLNYHINDNVLDEVLGEKKGFHGHQTQFHGYISIDPQNTITKFRNGLEIKNKIGQIYIGPGNKGINTENEWDHFVEVLSPSPKPRITIGFDFTDKFDKVLNNTCIPLL